MNRPYVAATLRLHDDPQYWRAISVSHITKIVGCSRPRAFAAPTGPSTSVNLAKMVSAVARLLSVSDSRSRLPTRERIRTCPEGPHPNRAYRSRRAGSSCEAVAEPPPLPSPCLAPADTARRDTRTPGLRAARTRREHAGAGTLWESPVATAAGPGAQNNATDRMDCDTCSRNTPPARTAQATESGRMSNVVRRRSDPAEFASGMAERSCEIHHVIECPFCARVAADADIIHARAAAVAFPDNFPVSEEACPRCSAPPPGARRGSRRGRVGRGVRACPAGLSGAFNAGGG